MINPDDLPRWPGHFDPQPAPPAQPLRLCAHEDCRFPLPVGSLYPLCDACRACECLVCGAEIVPVDGWLCDRCLARRALSALRYRWRLLRHDYCEGVYRS